MKKTLLVCLAPLLLLGACDEPQRATTESLPPAPKPDPLAAKTDTASVPPAPAPEVKPTAPTETAPPPAKPTAGSVVWTISRISVTTDDGVVGVPPGTKLRVVRESGNVYIVTDEKQEFPVTPAQISTSSDVATSAAHSDAAARAASAAWERTQSQKNSREANLRYAAGEIQTRYDQLAREEASLQASIARAHQEDYEASIASAQRRVYTRRISSAQVASWRARLPIVRAEKDKAFWELKKASQ